MLFVGLAHTLLLESYVSRMKMIEKVHPNTNSLTLDNLFMYRARRAREKGLRQDASQRCNGGGGGRVEAQCRREAGKALKGANRSKRQQRLMCMQAEARARRYGCIPLNTRGPNCIAKRLAQCRVEDRSKRVKLAKVKVESLRKSCRVTPTGRKRKAPLTLLGCRALLPKKGAAGFRFKKLRGYVPCPSHIHSLFVHYLQY